MGLQDWKEQVKEEQQNFASLLGDRIWERFQSSEREKLWDKIAFALLGPPRNANNKDRGYSEKEREKVDEIMDKCIKKCSSNGGNVDIAFLFVSCRPSGNKNFTVPLIRVKRGSGRNVKDSTFIDHAGRVYHDWQKFLDENIFNEMWICVPADAMYPCDSEVDLKFYNQTEKGKTLRNLDTISSVSSMTTSCSMAVGLAMTFFPPTALIGAATVTASTIVGVPGAVYSTGRSVGNLVDRGVHDQSLSLFDSEARGCWITTVASVLSVGTMGTAKFLSSTAKAGKLVGSTTRALCTALNITSLTVNGLGVINSIAEVSTKKEVTALDVLQLTTSIFFFTHSFVNFKTASGIIKEAQAQQLKMERSHLSAENKKVFDEMLKARREMVTPGKVREMHGNAEFIREMKSIKNKNEFFSTFQIQPNSNHLDIHGELVLDTKSFLQMEPHERDALLKNSEDLQKKKISEKQFNERIGVVKRKYNLMFENQKRDTHVLLDKAFSEAFGTSFQSIEVEGQKIFKDLKPHEVARLDNVLKHAGKNYSKDCLKVGYKMANSMGCKNVSEFTAIMEYTIRDLDAKVTAQCKANPNPPGRQQGVKASKMYQEQVYTEFLHSKEAQDQVMSNFNSLNAECSRCNSTGTPRFGNEFAATNHYDKHGYFPKVDRSNNLPPERYFQIARDMTNGTPAEPPIWTQDGSTLCCRFISEEYGAMAIRFDNLADKRSVIATLYSESRLYKR